MAKQIIYGEEARKALLSGINQDVYKRQELSCAVSSEQSDRRERVPSLY